MPLYSLMIANMEELKNMPDVVYSSIPIAVTVLMRHVNWV
jgi:hypothetical protein